jgi:translation elongation factor EF-Tu-like GTPase
MTVEDVFVVKGRGVVVTGRVESGTLRPGDEVNVNGGPPIRVEAIEAFRKRLVEAAVGDMIGVVFTDADRSQFHRGDVLSAPTVL